MAASGFISVDAASTPEIASNPTKEFGVRCTKTCAEYNDETDTKVHAVEYVLAIITANPAAMVGVKEFKTAMHTFAGPNPYILGDAKLNHVGATSFGQTRQFSAPFLW